MIRAGLILGLERNLWCAVIGLIAILVINSCSREDNSESVISSNPEKAGPLNITYRIDDVEIQLRDGRFEVSAAPDSAAMVTATVFGAPAYGDLDGGGNADAALILVYQTGGSGTFYFVAAAVNGAEGYQGTNVEFLGDRVIPRAIRIQDRTVVVNFADRAPSEPMAATPTIDVTRYAYLNGDSLVMVPADSKVSGWVTIGHEVRSFLPCDGNTEHWLLGRSPALADLENTYGKTMSNAQAYAPLFMVLTGSIVAPPDNGFGADYERAFFASGLIHADATAHCREGFIVVEAPTPGAVIESPLSIQGRARGTWFFEGDFPVILEDARGNSLANGFVTAQGEWMTKEFVPFTGTLSFTRPEQDDRGSLIFKKDNPSEKRELDDAMMIPIFFQE